MAGVTRVLLAQLGAAGDDETAQAVARSLRDSGFDVVFAGHLGSADGVVQAAMQEDVDVVGVHLGSTSGIASQLPGIKVVDLPEGMTVEDAVAAIRKAGS